MRVYWYAHVVILLLALGCVKKAIPTENNRDVELVTAESELQAYLKQLGMSGPASPALSKRCLRLFADWKKDLVIQGRTSVIVAPMTRRLGCAIEMQFDDEGSLAEVSKHITSSQPIFEWPGPKFRSGPIRRPLSRQVMVTWIFYDGESVSNRSSTPDPALPHTDHSPRHGGIFFMSDDGAHHIEGTLTRGNVLRVYVYDEYTRPIPLDGITGRASLLGIGGKEIALSLSSAGASLQAAVPVTTLPATITVGLAWPPARDESRFDFVFHTYSDD